MKGIRIGFILTTIAVFCFLLGCAGTAPSVKSDKKNHPCRKSV